jgi:hypothetical protein
MDRHTFKPDPKTRATDARLTSGDGHGGGGAPPVNRGTDPDMRGETMDTGDIRIRPDDTPPLYLADHGTSDPILRGGIEGDVTPGGVRIRGERDLTPLQGGGNVTAAVDHLKDVQTRRANAAKAAEQTERSMGDAEAQLETVKDQKGRGDIEKRLETLKQRHATEQRKLADLEAELEATQKTIKSFAEPNKNRYPDFESPLPTMKSTVDEQVAKLSDQLGLQKTPLDPQYALVAPWIGRQPNRSGKLMSSGTSEGWLRNHSRFWTAWKKRFPKQYRMLGADHMVTKEFAAAMGRRRRRSARSSPTITSTTGR